MRIKIIRDLMRNNQQEEFKIEMLKKPWLWRALAQDLMRILQKAI